ncbi:hypothetical protein EC881467_5771 [Escherichia coli 88.1467]|nr:hypothetical protein EC881467_5771 [Escherichia coli 88.1467]
MELLTDHFHGNTHITSFLMALTKNITTNKNSPKLKLP